jgi:hypothetical protein
MKVQNEIGKIIKNQWNRSFCNLNWQVNCRKEINLDANPLARHPLAERVLESI